MSLAEHQRMVADRVRVAAYQAAIRACVRPGDVVVDVGTGTGLLAVLAAQAGARRVYGLEWGSTQRVAEQVAKANGFADVVRVLPGDARRLELPERADWLVSELLGSFGLEENVLPILIDARSRHLKPGGGLIPGRLALVVAPVMAPATYDLLSFWETADLGLDLSPVAAAAKADLQRAEPADLTVLAPPQRWLDVDLATVTSPHHGASLRFRAAAAGLCHGFAGWFQAELAPGHWLGNGPDAQPTHWGCAFLPLSHPCPVQPDDELHLDLKSIYALDRTYWSWQWHWHGPAGAARGAGGSDALWAGLLPQAAPALAHPLALSADGEVVATVLALCREGKSEQEVIAALQTRLPGYADPAAAAGAVRRVLSRYGRTRAI